MSLHKIVFWLLHSVQPNLQINIQSKLILGLEHLSPINSKGLIEQRGTSIHYLEHVMIWLGSIFVTTQVSGECALYLHSATQGNVAIACPI